MEIIQDAVSEVLLNIALAALTCIGAYAVYYIHLGAERLKAQTSQLADEQARKLLVDALNDVLSLASLTVGAMEQTTAKALREAVKSGRADKEQLVNLSEQVFREVKEAIGPEAQRVITQNLGSFDTYLERCIEDSVLKLKG